ncbi:MAG: site-specific integrase [Methylobacter sp.]|nr:site-specific integrase [Methylobacter sp.]
MRNISYYVGGKEKQKKIGRYGKGKMTLKAIRDKYTELSKEYQSGIDVKAQETEQAAAAERERQAQAAIERKAKLQGSFRQLIDLYLEYAKTNLSNHYYQSVNRAFLFNLKDFDTNLKVSEIAKGDINSILNPIINRGSLVMANRMRSYLLAAFNWGIEFDDPDNPAKTVQFFIESNPVAKIKKALKKENPVDRFLDETEVYTLWQGLNQSSMSVHRANVLKLMLATGARLEALSGLQWHEIDWNERLITIPPKRSKNGQYWVIPLNDIAHEILLSNPRLDDVFLFPAGNGIEPLRTDSFSQATTRLCLSIGMKHFTPRDLRITFKTLGGKAGLDKDIRDRLQNHALTDVSAKHYDRYDYLLEKRRAMKIWNTYLQRIIDNSGTAQVIPFKKNA